MTSAPKKIVSPQLPENITEFAPVPRKGDTSKGWSPARQKAFIQSLAETGSVKRAAAEVNMSHVSAYYLRRHPQGDEFKRAWDLALEFSLSYLKDIAFERAIEGELEPVWQRGKLVGYKRKFNDRLLMFLLRQYGSGRDGRRVTVNYVKSSASAGAATDGAPDRSGKSAAAAESSVVTVRSSQDAPALPGKATEAASGPLMEFEGAALDAQARAEMAQVIADCEKRRAEFGGTTADVNEAFVHLKDSDPYWQGNFEPEGGWIYDVKDVDS